MGRHLTRLVSMAGICCFLVAPRAAAQVRDPVKPKSRAQGVRPLLQGPLDLRPFYRVPSHASLIPPTSAGVAQGCDLVGGSAPAAAASANAVAALRERLNAALSTVTVVTNTTAPVSPGQTIRAYAGIPPAAGIPAILDQPVDLDLLLKGALFADQDFNAAVIDEPLPIFDFEKASVLADGVTPLTIYARIDKVPGYPGRLCGLLPVATQVYPTLKVAWSVRDSRNRDLVEGTHYALDPRVDAPPTELGVVIRPPLTELVSGASLSTATFILVATVTLCMSPETTSEVCSESREAAVEVPVLRLPVPTLLALYNSDDFKGRWLLVVPENSPLEEREELESALATLRETIDLATSLASLLPITGELATILEEMKVNSTLQHFVKKDRIPKLSAYDMEGASLDDWNGEDADNYFNSLIFLSAGRRVYCYNEKEYNTDDSEEPWFRLKRKAGGAGVIALIANLGAGGSQDLAIEPGSGVMEADLYVHDEEGDHAGDDFQNSMSSMKFGDP